MKKFLKYSSVIILGILLIGINNLLLIEGLKKSITTDMKTNGIGYDVVKNVGVKKDILYENLKYFNLKENNEYIELEKEEDYVFIISEDKKYLVLDSEMIKSQNNEDINKDLVLIENIGFTLYKIDAEKEKGEQIETKNHPSSLTYIENFEETIKKNYFHFTISSDYYKTVEYVISIDNDSINIEKR